MASARESSKKASRRAVGEFIVEKEIGKGSFAQVYLGWQKVCGSFLRLQANPSPT